MILKNILTEINYLKSTNIELDIEIENITDNSREVVLNSIFVAISGNAFDGNNYIINAIGNGAKLVVTDKESVFEINKNNIPIILVNNSRIILVELLNIFYNYPSKDFKIVAITGTNGKTTISTLIYNAFIKLNKNVALIGTNGIYINSEKSEATHTTPSPIQLITLFLEFKKNNIEYVIMEVSSHSLDQHRVDFIDFDVAIFTNLTRDHLDYHKTMENYATAKKKLFDGLKPDTIAIINNDDEWSNFMIKDCKGKIETISRNKNSTYQISNLISDINGNKFNLICETNSFNIYNKLLSSFNAYNLASAVLCLNYFNIKNISDLISNISGPEGRMDSIKLHNGTTAIIDYAHTPDALEKALQNLKELCQGKLICVFGCGGDRDKGKRPIMGAISTDIADYTYITSDNPRTENPNEIINDIIVNIKSNNFEVEIDRSVAIRKAILNSNKNDIILIAGKGHEKYQIIGTNKFHFDDFEEIRRVDNE